LPWLHGYCGRFPVRELPLLLAEGGHGQHPAVLPTRLRTAAELYEAVSAAINSPDEALLSLPAALDAQLTIPNRLPDPR
jgi:hypothetical protein